MSQRDPCIQTERLTIYLPGLDDAPLVVDYYERNREHLAPWEPVRAAEFYTDTWWQRQLGANRREFLEDRGMRSVIQKKDDPDRRVIGVANLSNFVRGAFQACHLGYSIDRECEGQGFMREALEGVIQFAFEKLRLHRIMANYQPDNVRSGALLDRLGFVQEGFAKDFLYINGAWRDHVLTAIWNSDAGP